MDVAERGADVAGQTVGDDRLRLLVPVVPGVRLWSLRLDPRPSDAGSARLDDADARRMAGLRAAEAARFLARRALHGTALAPLLGCRPDEVALDGTAGPFEAVAPSGRRCHVSLSASGQWGLLAAAADRVGADLESLPGPPDARHVSRLVLRPEEDAWISGSPDGAAERFLRTWVRKEAVVKYTGEGLTRDLRSFVVDGSADSAEVRHPDGRPTGITTHAVPFAGHVAAVAVGTGR